MNAEAGYIYAIKAEGTNYIKIGATTGAVEKRLKRLQTGQPFPLTLLAVVRIDQPPRVIEGQIHALLSPYRHRGEWFDIQLDEGQLQRLVAAAELALVQQQEEQQQPLKRTGRGLARVLQVAMQERGWSIRQLSARSGVDYTTIHNILSGRRPDPRFSVMVAIAWPLQLDLWALAAEQFLAEEDAGLDALNDEPYSRPEGHGLLVP